MPKLPWFSLLLLLLTRCTLASAQGVVIGSVSTFNGPGRGQIGQPYTATKVTSSGQKLANGTILAHTSTTKEARDSQGRTMTQSTPLLGSELAPKMTATNVFDPTTGTHTHWTDREKVATIFHFPVPAEMAARRASQASTPAPSAEASSLKRVPAAGPAGDPALRPMIQREKLGSQSIAGIYAEGERTTTTLPTDSVGNSRPIIIVREIWRSPT